MRAALAAALLVAGCSHPPKPLPPAALERYHAEHPIGAVIIAPGGGYVAWGNDVRPEAAWLTAHHYEAFVLKYRLKLPEAIADGNAAVDQVRALGFKKVGLWGISAGGHLDALVADRRKVDFLVLFAPWLEATRVTRGKSPYCSARTEPCDPKAYAALAPRPVAVPAFIVQGGADGTASPLATLDYARALEAAGAPAEIHLVARKGHGELGTMFPDWRPQLAAWLAAT